ncbi:NAD(P)-binding protein [Stipitochalara longipes BDJ]|nr:NAD(P)-binding protein [Stipitochalara longipes BDJ]
MPWSLVSPASRGIGFHLTRHLLQTTKIPVVATARKDVEGVRKSILQDLPNIDSGRLTVLNLDFTNETSIQRAAEDVKSMFTTANHLHLAFAIPGILYPEKSPSQLDHAHLSRTFAINTIGPLLLMKHFTPFLPTKSTKLSQEPGLPPHAVWLTTSARVGSTTDNQLGGWFSYRASKAGVTSISKSLDLYLKGKSGDNAMAMAYHPGTVKTDLSKEFWSSVPKEKLFTPEYAVGKMVGIVQNIGLEQRGRCWDWKRTEVLP